MVMVFNTTFNNLSVISVVVSFIGGGNRSRSNLTLLYNKKTKKITKIKIGENNDPLLIVHVHALINL
jgi:hypothetical protein